MARSALRVALPRSGLRVALPRSGLRVALPRSGVLKTVHFRRFDPLRSKIFFGPRATRDGQRATRERYAQALRASATRKLRLRQSLDNFSRLVELLRLLRLLRPFGIITCHQERLPVTGVGRPGIVKL